MWSIQNDVRPIFDLVPKFEHKKIVQTFFLQEHQSVPAGVYQLPAKTSKWQFDPRPAFCFEAHLTSAASAASAGPGGVKTMQSAEATKLCLNIQAFF